MTMSKFFVAPNMRYTRTTSGGEKEHQRTVEMSRIDELDRDVLKIELGNGDSIEITMTGGLV